jgi:hypothetical protein
MNQYLQGNISPPLGPLYGILAGVSICSESGLIKQARHGRERVTRRTWLVYASNLPLPAYPHPSGFARRQTALPKFYLSSWCVCSYSRHAELELCSCHLCMHLLADYYATFVALTRHLQFFHSFYIENVSLFSLRFQVSIHWYFTADYWYH